MACMTNSPQSNRKSALLLTLFLFGVLLASVGIAYWIVQARSAAARTGEGVLRAIRDKGLPHWWPEAKSVECFVVQDAAGQVKAWQIHYRSAVGGGFAGGQIIRDQDSLSEEQWEIAADASQGQYKALIRIQQVVGRQILDRSDETHIALAKNVVQVRPRADMTPVSAVMPANYIPEGLSPLVLFLTAQGGEPAVYRMIFNQTAVANRQVNFETVRALPLSPLSAGLSTDGDDTPEEVYHFDKDGLILKIEYPRSKATVRRVTPDELRRIAPKAADALKAIEQRTPTPPSPEADNQPLIVI